MDRQIVLQEIAERSQRGRDTRYDDLVRVLGLSPESAYSYLSRLWRHGLIEAVPPRPRGLRFRLGRAESLRTLAFRLAPRGRARLQRWHSPETQEGLL